MVSFNNKNIAIFRALQLGDLLCAIPAIRAIKTAFPDARLTLIGLPWAEAFAVRFSEYFDDFIVFPGYPGLPEQEYEPARFLTFQQVMKTAGFDYILQMQGNGTIVNDMLRELDTGTVMGFTIDNTDLKNKGFLLYPNYGHEISRHLTLVAYLGIPQMGTHLEFPIKDTDHAQLNALNLPVEQKKYVCIHPGSRGAWRQWPTAHFASLADLCARSGFEVLVTGTASEAAIVNDVTNHMRYPAINLAGKTSLGAIGALIEGAYLLISNCTGVSHIAAALETPSLVISMDGEPERWGPINTRIHHTIDWTRNPDFALALNTTEKILRSN
jgi:ADP-heptose:LPS heptosyltransferase